MDNTVYFYAVQEAPYGVFSNFSRHPFELEGETWKTSEHYFQAQKFVNSRTDFEAVRDAPTPNKAAEFGRDRKRPLRVDWEDVKDDAMRRALYAKFKAFPYLEELLISTGDRPIVEKTTYDYYWGCGTRGTGKNMLGILLEELRGRLNKERAEAHNLATQQGE